MFARKRTSQSLGGVGELRLEGLEDVQVGDEGLALVQVGGRVYALPEERLAVGDDLDVVGQGAAGAQRGEGLLVEVAADRADHADLVEERRGEREVGGGTSEHALALPGRGLDGVIGDGSDHGEGHGEAG